MIAALGIMDGPRWSNRTDVIVVADDQARTLLWVPRDAYCERIENRINVAFRNGGHELFLACLNDLGIAATESACLLRTTTEKMLARCVVVVPVAREMVHRYPATPGVPIENGERVIRFSPPSETLEGARIHEWLGARYGEKPYLTPLGGDLDRCMRQGIFVKAVLEQKPEIPWSLVGEARTTTPEALDAFRRIDASWSISLLAGMAPATIRDMRVLVKKPS